MAKVMKKKKMEERRPIASTLRKMEVGEQQTFPIEQTGTIRTSMRTTLIGLTARGWKWSTKCDYPSRSVLVTRVS